MTIDEISQTVSDYYGNEIEKTEDLEAGACCTADYDAALTSKLTEEVLEKRYGCGSPFPDLLEGKTVLDLGSGAGADCFVASQLVGPSGRVVGVDMSEEQLDVARRNVEPHMEQFGYDEPNVEFRRGRIEEVPVEDSAVDVVISNCVINLSPDKQAVFEEIWRVLRPGGEFYVSDIVADRRIPEHLARDEKLWSECLTGALYEPDLTRLEARVGFRDTRVVEERETGDVLEGIRFRSQIRRGFKIDLEPGLEDYGQVAVYLGTIPGEREEFQLDNRRRFPAGSPVRVSGNTASILTNSRFAEHFEVSERLRHLGAFSDSDGSVDGGSNESAVADPTNDEVSVDEPSTEAPSETTGTTDGSCCG